jgi:hypothetical protein
VGLGPLGSTIGVETGSITLPLSVDRTKRIYRIHNHYYQSKRLDIGDYPLYQQFQLSVGNVCYVQQNVESSFALPQHYDSSCSLSPQVNKPLTYLKYIISLVVEI